MSRKLVVIATVCSLVAGALALLLDYLFEVSQRDNGDLNIGTGVEIFFAELLLFLFAGFLSTWLVGGRPVTGSLTALPGPALYVVITAPQFLDGMPSADAVHEGVVFIAFFLVPTAVGVLVAATSYRAWKRPGPVGANPSVVPPIPPRPGDGVGPFNA